jgi:hypothetical protein
MTLAILVGSTAPAPAMLQKLNDEQTKDAIILGKRSVKIDIFDFLKEWMVDLGNDKGTAFIITEFLALSNASRDAALRQLELNKFDIEDTLAKSSGKMVFRVTVFGSKADFAKDYTASIQAGSKVVPTTFWKNNEGESYGDGTSRPAYVADNDYYFPSEGIDPNAKITLVVHDKDGKDVVKFDFDLAKLR